MLIVPPVSALLAVLITLSRLWVFTLNRVGPFGEAPVFGTKAKRPRIAMLFNWFGYAPVTNLKSSGAGVAGGAIRPSASPAALKPVSASGFSVIVPVTVSVAADITVT